MTLQRELLSNFGLILTTQMSLLKGELSGRALPRTLVEAVKGFDQIERHYLSVADKGGVDDVIQSVKAMATNAIHVSNLIQADESGVGRDAAIEIAKESRAIVEEIDKGDAFFSSIESSDPKYTESRKSGAGYFSDDFSRLRRELDEITIRLEAVALNCAKTEATANGSQEAVNKALEVVGGVYEAAEQEISQKKGQIDKILGHVAGRALAGDFDKNASGEKRNADLLRFFSVACMAFTVILVGFTFYESAFGDFDWKVAISRVFMALVLSVPAGYLARESSRHRHQQQLYLQTSLSLKALPAYIASLPDEMQHKLKAEMTQRIFSMGTSPSSDLGVLNVQDLMLELIRRFDANK